MILHECSIFALNDNNPIHEVVPHWKYFLSSNLKISRSAIFIVQVDETKLLFNITIMSIIQGFAVILIIPDFHLLI